MRFFTIATLALTAVASPVAVADISAELEQLAALAPTPSVTNLPGASVRCGGQDPRAEVFTVDQIKLAAVVAFKHIFDGTQVGIWNFFPKLYKYKDSAVHFPEAACNHNQFLAEFPITRGIYTGGPTTDLAHRIVVRKRGGGEVVVCGLITHVGAPVEGGAVAPYTSCSW